MSLAYVLPVQLQEVVGLEQLVGELGVADAFLAVQSAGDGLSVEQRGDAHVFASLASSTNLREVAEDVHVSVEVEVVHLLAGLGQPTVPAALV